ncbi:MAG: hypothetical protein ABI903_03625 [Actinomycetota bacterium]
MRYVRRLTLILSGCATWVIASAMVASAAVQPEPPLVGDQWWNDAPSASTTTVVAAATPLWQTIAIVALGTLLVIAVGGLFYSLEHQRSRRSQTSTSHGAHA